MKGIGMISAVFLAVGVGIAVDHAGKTPLIAIIQIVLGAAGIGAVLGAIADNGSKK